MAEESSDSRGLRLTTGPSAVKRMVLAVLIPFAWLWTTLMTLFALFLVADGEIVFPFTLPIGSLFLAGVLVNGSLRRHHNAFWLDETHPR